MSPCGHAARRPAVSCGLAHPAPRRRFPYKVPPLQIEFEENVIDETFLLGGGLFFRASRSTSQLSLRTVSLRKGTPPPFASTANVLSFLHHPHHEQSRMKPIGYAQDNEGLALP